MFCSQCGNEFPEGAAYCPMCGAPAPGTGKARYPGPSAEAGGTGYSDPHAGTGAGYTPPGQKPATMSSNDDYTKMGGWLLFFMVLSIIGSVMSIIEGISAATQLGRASGYLSALGLNGYSDFGALGTTFTIISAVLNLVLVYFVFTRKPVFLRFYQIIGFIGIAFSIIETLSASGYVYGAGAVVGSLIGTIVFAVVFLCLFTMYYCRSVRVRTYMDGTEHIKQAIFTIGITKEEKQLL